MIGGDAAQLHALDEGIGQQRHLFRIAGKGPVADDRIGAGHGHVQQGRAIDGDAVLPQQRADRPAVEAGGDQCARRIGLIELAEARRRRELRPDRRIHALVRAAFMIDQDRRVMAADRLAEILAQAAHPVGRLAIALEQDQAQRIGFAEESALRVGENGAGRAEDDGQRNSGHGIFSL